MHEDAELIAAKSGDQNVVPNDVPNASGYDPQHLITKPVPIKVVYGLEMIEVDYEYGGAFGMAGRFENAQLL
jgi:hypothetical protein